MKTVTVFKTGCDYTEKNKTGDQLKKNCVLVTSNQIKLFPSKHIKFTKLSR